MENKEIDTIREIIEEIREIRGESNSAGSYLNKAIDNLSDAIEEEREFEKIKLEEQN